MDIVLRRARPSDREAILIVEKKSTPTLQYLPSMFEDFQSDVVGDLSVEEVDGELAACGKYTIVPDGSAWLETLRVIPERQGIGLGKRLYEHWIALAKAQGVKDIRMYTTLNNVVSSGLAERFGLKLQGTFNGYSIRPNQVSGNRGGFRPVSNVNEATKLLMPLSDAWKGWLVMNRTFYRFSTELCQYLAEKGMVFYDVSTSSVVSLGARFMPWQTLNIGAWGGDSDACLDFAEWLAAERGIPIVSCLHESTSRDISKTLVQRGFKPDVSQYIVKGIRLA